MAAGIVDPTKVVRYSVAKTAASIAALLLTTDAAVAEVQEKPVGRIGFARLGGHGLGLRERERVRSTGFSLPHPRETQQANACTPNPLSNARVLSGHAASPFLATTLRRISGTLNAKSRSVAG
jgi:hypothetical protein